MQIERKKILDSDSTESLSDRRIFGGKPDGMINFSRPKYMWASDLWSQMEANTWFK